MKRILVILLLFCISCEKDQEVQPEGDLLDKIVTTNLNGTGFRYFTRTYVYDQKRLVKIIADMDGVVNYELRLNYDTQGKLVKTEKLSGSTLLSWTYEYNNKNRIIKINTPSSSGIYNSTYDYDSFDNVIKYSAFDNVNNELSHYMIFECDNKGNRVSREEFVNNNGTIEHHGKFTFTYDAMKNPFNREELQIPAYFENCYMTGGKSDHNFLYESSSPGGIIASAPISYSYYKNGLPKAQWYSAVSNTDSIYYYYK